MRRFVALALAELPGRPRDVETSVIDSDALEELNPYTFFASTALYVGRMVNPAQLRAVAGTAITTAIAEHGPTVISMPGDAAAPDVHAGPLEVALPATPAVATSREDLAAMATLIN